MRWSWAGAVALVLAVCVGVAYAITLVLIVAHDEPLTATGAALLYVTSGTLIGGVITYMARREDRDDDDPDDP